MKGRFGLRAAIVACLLAVLAVVLPPTFFSSCKKDKEFKIERKWRVATVTREGREYTDCNIKVGDRYEFKADGSYEYRNASGSHKGAYRFDKSKKQLVLGDLEYYVYYSEGDKLTFGLVRFQADAYTVALVSQ